MSTMHEANYQVGPDGKVVLHDLTPGQTVHVTVTESVHSSGTGDWGPGNVPGAMVYRPRQARTPRDRYRGRLTRYDRPFEPACEPTDWQAGA